MMVLTVNDGRQWHGGRKQGETVGVHARCDLRQTKSGEEEKGGATAWPTFLKRRGCGGRGRGAWSAT
jgi:hypothetical protein